MLVRLNRPRRTVSSNTLVPPPPWQELLHTVVELGFTSSVQFLQAGLNIRGHARPSSSTLERRGLPRQSWVMRKLQEQAAQAEGLSAWQVNPYFASGRVTVPASIDTFTCEVRPGFPGCRHACCAR